MSIEDINRKLQSSGVNTRRINSFMIALKEIDIENYNKIDKLHHFHIDDSIIYEYIRNCDFNKKRKLLRKINELVYLKEKRLWKDEWEP